MSAAQTLGRSSRHLVRRPTLVVSVVVVVTLAWWIIAPGSLTSYDPVRGEIVDKLLPPSGDHWFGTDSLGRDLFSRVVHGTRVSVAAAAVAVLVGASLATIIGGIAGYFGGFVDGVSMRLVDIFLAVPGLLIAFIVISVLGQGTVDVAIAVGIASAASLARITRSEVRRVGLAPYVQHSRDMGAGSWRVLRSHVIPNSTTPVATLLLPEFAGAILAVSALSYLGFGAQPPTPEWGSLVAEGRAHLSNAWWLVTLPSATIVACVLALFVIGRNIRGAQGRRA
ncbi:ABC transporter permease [Rhodococcoides kyotonense]|uniref:Peptide/nickel transport system permease protein n=1 Tax=Rhodococcoides kyotonense TaxID=398843 RepID=A0A239MAU1_9NOCA|nr:ABC transporter permease [Rhodococcus kyotonensis]SNT39865.1 peptide/nickel transport system permease protein [Rhodococcus kyotonensis]